MLLPGSSGQIHVLREELIFDLFRAIDQAPVTARYEMENRGEALARYPVLFVIQDQGRWGERPFSVTWNGQPLQAKILEDGAVASDRVADVKAAWGAMEAVYDPIKQEFYTIEFYGGSGLTFIEFPLDLPAGARGTLEVAYEQVAAQDRTRYAHRLYHYHYLLSPAKGWASFGPVTIRIPAPEPKRLFFGSNIDFTYVDGEYRAELPGLPAENLAFSVMSRDGIIGDWVTPGPYYGIAFLLLLILAWLVGLGIGRLAAQLKFRNRAWVVITGVLGGLFVGGLVDAVLVPLVFALFPALGGDGYGWAIMGVMQWIIAAPLTIITAGVVAGRRYKKPADPPVQA